MNINIIVAASQNNCIGKQNKLPWHISNDLKYFKKLTTNHCIIMGRNTFESIGKALPNRVNIVLSKSNYQNKYVVVRDSIQAALDYCKLWQQQDVFIIGGDSIYQQTLDVATTIYLTRVETTIENGDAFFPTLDEKKWELINAQRHDKDDKNEFDHIFETYTIRTSEPIIYS
jgi:dihydrofolate reductase